MIRLGRLQFGFLILQTVDPPPAIGAYAKCLVKSQHRSQLIGF